MKTKSTNSVKYLLLSLAALLSFGILKSYFQFDIPEVVGWALWIVASIAYFQVLIDSIKEGQINFGGRSVWKYKNPILFWIAVIIHTVLSGTIFVVCSYQVIQYIGQRL